MLGSRFTSLVRLGVSLIVAFYALAPAYAADELKYKIKAAPFNRSGDLGYWAAVDQGYFRQSGVDVESETLETRVLARDAVTSGSVEVSHVSINTSLPAFEAGEPIKVAAIIFPRYPIVAILNQHVLTDNNLTEEAFRKLDAKQRFSLLKGKNIAFTAAGGLEDQTFRAQVKSLGFGDADEFANIQYVQSYAALEANFLQGRLDAIVSDAANGKWYSKHGQGIQLLTGDEQDRYVPETVIPAGAWIVNTEWLAKNNNADGLRAYLAAWVKGNQWVAKLPEDKFREWVLTGFPEVKEPAAQEKLLLTAATNREQSSIDGKIDPKLLKRVVDFALAQKTIKNGVPVDTIYTGEYLP